MGDHFQKLLMAPDIMLMRGDIKISDEDKAIIPARCATLKIGPHIF